jgi:AraC family transcriptional regulator
MEAPRFEDRGSFLLAGLTGRYHHDHHEGIPAQWQRFGPQHMGKIPGQLGWTSYGVCFNFDGTGNFDYMCAVEVGEALPLPPPLTHLPVAPQHYAVFTHRDHISKIGPTWDAIYNEWPKESGRTLIEAPQFESYSEDFNPQTGTGIVEIWIPVHNFLSQ